MKSEKMATTKKLKIQDTNAGDLNPKRKPKPKPPSPSKAAIARKEAEMSATAKKVINQKTKKATKKKSVTVKEGNLLCSCCGEVKPELDYYLSYSRLNKARGRVAICKDCTLQLFEDLLRQYGSIEVAIYRICFYLDVPFFKSALEGAFEQVSKENKIKDKDANLALAENQMTTFQRYMKNIVMPQWIGYTFNDGEEIDTDNAILEYEIKSAERSSTDADKQNERDVLRILGYDPFENENPRDRKFLFNRTVDMLNDSVLNDNVKLMSVLSVVKTFNQIENIDISIAALTKDGSNLGDKAGSIKTLVQVKKDLNAMALKLCEDNGLSEKYNTSKSVGAGTLSAKIKEMHEMGLEEEKTNLYDIETSKGMKQVAKISAEAIIDKLRLQDNDYADMVAEQREMVVKAQEERDEAKEKLRLVRVENKKLLQQLEELKKSGE